MTENTPQGASAAPGSDPHIHCWHWGAAFDEHGHAVGTCCFDGESVEVSPENPVLRGEHGPHTQA